MAISFILNDEAVNDQTTGLQTGDLLLPEDPYTDTDVAYSSLSQGIRDYLQITLGLNSAFPTSVGVATKTNSVTVNASANSALTDIVFTDSAGGALDGDDSLLNTADGKDILLYADGDDIVIGKYDSDGNGSLDAVAFVVFKEDVFNADKSSAQVTFHIVTYTGISHPDDTDPDDAVDLGNTLKIAASEFVQLDFADLPAGQNLHGTIAIDKTDLTKGGLLLFPKGTLLNPDGTFTNLSPTTNTSKGGGEVTIGNTNQMFDPGEGHFFIYVDDPVAASVAGVGLNQNNSDDADTIGFSGTLPQTTAQVEIVQVQGNDLATMRITAYDFTFATAVNTPGEARDLVTDPLDGNSTEQAPTSAATVDIIRIKVLDENGNVIEDSDLGGQQDPNITISFVGDTAVVAGLSDDYTVEWTTAAPHDGVLIEDIAGKYDLGGFNLLNTANQSTFVGQQIVIEDDGPSAVITDTGVDVVHDETAGVQDGTEAADVSDPTSDPGTDDDQLAVLPAAFPAGAIGWALSPSAVVNSNTSAFGTDLAGSTSWSLDVPAPNTDSGLVDLNGDSILLGVEGSIVVGRVDDDGDNSVDGTDQIAIAILLDSNQKLAVAQYIPIGHLPDTGPDQVATMLDSALLAKLTVTDADGDTSTITEPIGNKVKIEDDAAAAENPAAGVIEEEHLDNAQSVGNEDTVDDEDLDDDTDAPDPVDFNQTTNVHVRDLGAIVVVQPGVDAPVSFSLDGTQTGLLPVLSSKEGVVSYEVSGDTLTAFVDDDTTAGYQAAEDREVFTWQVTAAGIATLTLLDQLNNPVPLAGAVEDLLSIDLTPILVVKDKDNDPVTLDDGFAEYQVIDDVPIFTANTANGRVDFTTISGANPDDFGGTSVSSVTNSLNGSVGADENDANNLTGDLSADPGDQKLKTYTFASATIANSTIAGLKSDISDDGTTARFFVDGTGGGTPDVFDAAFDTLWFSNVLSQTANGGAGSYTFTVHEQPVPAVVELDFADLPAGQNLHGTIAIDKTDLTKGGLLLFPKGTLLNPDGTFTNLSPTTNTSKGGGEVTIGNTNQMFDPGEGHFFIYVDDPVAASVAGVGLNQNNSDDADTIGFSGTLPQTTAQVEIVQVQGNDLATMRITAYDFTFATAVNTPGEARDLVTDPLDGNSTEQAPTSAATVDIIRIKVLDENGNVIEDSDLGGQQDPNITISFVGDTAVVAGLSDDYTVEWTTAAPHDGVLIEDIAGKYDLGGFNLFLEQPTPDQQFDFTVALTDFDGDQVISNEFSIGVDGTGVNDDDAVVLV